VQIASVEYTRISVPFCRGTPILKVIFQDRRKIGRLDLEAVEMAVRSDAGKEVRNLHGAHGRGFFTPAPRRRGRGALDRNRGWAHTHHRGYSMPKGRVLALATLAAFLALAIPAGAQSVISTHSGVIHFFEGAVYLGDQPLESHLGKFPSVPQGAELRTADGRAEVLLTPGVFLRMGEGSAIRMVAADLADTQVELRSGAVIVDSGEPNPGTSVTVNYKNWRVHFLQKGVYRIDADPPNLWVHQGQAEVFDGPDAQAVSVNGGMKLPLAGALAADRFSEESGDALSEWNNGRGQSIAADDAITAQIDEDPAAQTGADAFTYYPFLGLSSLGVVSSPYGAYSPYQLGFNSIYLPGYTYAPFLLGIGGLGMRTSFPSLYPRVGVLPRGGVIVPAPRVPVPSVRPAPAPVHAPPRVVVHGGVHR
jgi:hypothetical protein